MDSTLIAPFLNSTYPLPSLPLSSPLGETIQNQSRNVLAPVFRISIMPRELLILSPRSQDYFRVTREKSLGCSLETLLEGNKEEELWEGINEKMEELAGLMRTNADQGPFLSGKNPNYIDFFIAGSLQSVRIVNDGVWKRCVKYPGFMDIYMACLPWMKKAN